MAILHKSSETFVISVGRSTSTGDLESDRGDKSKPLFGVKGMKFTFVWVGKNPNIRAYGPHAKRLMVIAITGMKVAQ